ncbi:GNAT family N-acetyltransferase [[Muricauda] lutisoli]|uniref:GNAT family N-acetyltransferase n=1 Tax=[Muricauda] lutisoli TaxID=2816035 RepID=A0ABS3EXN9_9FLAO|nr:GNAT family N-acetyltransferase [[Muricauda] lutisoli]MBO0331023.1 GNAT family N-acetyltransferase [[Muricauda] lutisoli]
MSELVKINYLKETDAEDLCCMMTSNADIFNRFFTKTLSQNKSVESSRLYIAKKAKEIERRLEFTYAIRHKDNRVIGLVILKDIHWDTGAGELAYCLDKHHQGKGIVSQSVKNISELAFEKLKLKKLKIFAHKSNIASIKVAEKTGFHWAQTVSKAYQPPNEDSLDMEIYELDYER